MPNIDVYNAQANGWFTIKLAQGRKTQLEHVINIDGESIKNWKRSGK